MNVQAGSVKQSAILNDAILPNRGSKAGLLERAFALLFRGLVYPQIWEDPVADMACPISVPIRRRSRRSISMRPISRSTG